MLTYTLPHYAYGQSAALTKFAIDAAQLRKLTSVYGYMPPERFQQMLRNRMNSEARGLPTPSPSAFIPPPQNGPQVSFNAQQLQGMSTPEVFQRLAGRAPVTRDRMPIAERPLPGPQGDPSAALRATLPQDIPVFAPSRGRGAGTAVQGRPRRPLAR